MNAALSSLLELSECRIIAKTGVGTRQEAGPLPRRLAGLAQFSAEQLAVQPCALRVGVTCRGVGSESRFERQRFECVGRSRFAPPRFYGDCFGNVAENWPDNASGHASHASARMSVNIDLAGVQPRTARDRLVSAIRIGGSGLGD